MALKAMRKHLVIEELNVEGTHTERSVLEQIQHPFVVRLHCAFHDTGRLYLLMDWHNGGHLLRLLQVSMFQAHMFTCMRACTCTYMPSSRPTLARDFSPATPPIRFFLLLTACPSHVSFSRTGEIALH